MNSGVDRILVPALKNVLTFSQILLIFVGSVPQNSLLLTKENSTGKGLAEMKIFFNPITLWEITAPKIIGI